MIFKLQTDNDYVSVFVVGKFLETPQLTRSFYIVYIALSGTSFQYIMYPLSAIKKLYAFRVTCGDALYNITYKGLQKGNN